MPPPEAYDNVLKENILFVAIGIQLFVPTTL